MEPTFREAIRTLRESKGLSLSEAGELIGCTKTHIYDMEHGNARNPTIQVLAGIAAAFEVDVGWLAILAARDAPGGTVRTAVADLVRARRRLDTAKSGGVGSANPNVITPDVRYDT